MALASRHSTSPRMSLFVIVAVLLGFAGVCSADPPAACTACSNYLLSGVADSQLSDSGYYCQAYTTQCSGFYGGTATSSSAKSARLNATGFIDGGWIATNTTTANDYVQVDFLCPKVITSIALKGRDPATIPGKSGTVNQYVKTYKVRISTDCTNFEYISNGTTPIIFTGNTTPNDVVVANLPKWVAARCVRVMPVEFFGKHKTLRFDVLGC